MKLLYAIPTHMCNLKCPHCVISQRGDDYDRDKFIGQLINFEGDGINIFGGEPTLYENRLFDIIKEVGRNGKTKIGGISTNLTILTDRLMGWYKELGGVATSWNPNRFPDRDVFNLWMRNCQKLADHGITYTLMITLTWDLFRYYPPQMMVYYLKEQLMTRGMTRVKFEPFVGDDATPDYFHVADQWMAEVVRLWDLPAELDMIQRAKHWHFDCRDVYTLLPDGTLVNRCPHLVEPHVPEACYTCSNVASCKPCPVQRYCSYLPETVRAVKEKEGIDENERY